MDPSGFEILQTAVLLLDESGRIRFANAAAETLLGVSRRQLHGQAAAPYLADQTSFLKTPLSSPPWAWLLEIPVHQGGRYEDRLQALADQAAQRETLRNLAHEVRNPLAGLRAAAQLLDMELTRDDLHDYTRVIIEEADRLADLVTRLVSPQRQDFEPIQFNIHEICERVLALIELEFGQQLTVIRDYDASAPDIWADRDRLLQALLNVVRNAAQALTEAEAVQAPTLQLRTRILHQPVLLQGQHRLGLLLGVMDNGPGVPVALQDKVFHPLVTGRAQGSGLGLNLAQACLQQHGGVLEFDSQPGLTEFRFLLPLDRP
ncbi:nitrogen regulation protein NR(II) [Castellaniella sp.]|uniref:nitrogen regulation protein NR(II) n=1 Tax=Castellaniella sp. TaxID=1955812 RepID=UPI002AFECEA0|nr:nitrogen regulation protein NR(II) [Castellaniella sp.]